MIAGHSGGLRVGAGKAQVQRLASRLFIRKLREDFQKDRLGAFLGDGDRNAAQQHGVAAKGLQIEGEVAQAFQACQSGVMLAHRKLQSAREQQLLAGHRAAAGKPRHSLIKEDALVGGALVDDHQAALDLADEITQGAQERHVAQKRSARIGGDFGLHAGKDHQALAAGKEVFLDRLGFLWGRGEQFGKGNGGFAGEKCRPRRKGLFRGAARRRRRVEGKRRGKIQSTRHGVGHGVKDGRLGLEADFLLLRVNIHIHRL